MKTSIKTLSVVAVVFGALFLSISAHAARFEGVRHQNWQGWDFDYQVSGNFDGVSLTKVKYQGVDILGKASLPVMRVFYDNNVCGPYADRLGGSITPISWANNDPLVLREFTQSGRQWLEIGIQDTIGNYVIYQSWYLSADGILDGHIFSKGLQCNINHIHYPYWRMDFDLAGKQNDQVRRFVNGDWQIVTTESNESVTSANNHRWQVRDTVTGDRVDIEFGAAGWSDISGTVNPVNSFENNRIFGRRYKDSENRGWTHGARSEVPYDNNENINNQDIVVWYKGYMPHDAAEGQNLWHSTGVRFIVNLATTTPPGGEDRPFAMLIRTTNTGVSSDTQFLIETKGSGYHYNVDCDNDGNLEATGITGNYTCDYTVSDDYIISISGTFPQLYFDDNSDAAKVIDIIQWGTQVWRSMEQACNDCRNMIVTASDTPDLSQVTSLRNMFRGAKNFNQDIGHWDVSHVTDMSGMFRGASAFNQYIGDWDVSNVTNMTLMFNNNDVFDQYIGDWNVSKVTDMSLMFSGASSFNQPISDWNVSKVTNMSHMFESASSFNHYIGDWNVSKVTDMSHMFSGASVFNQYTGEWEVSKVTNMVKMFQGATSFNQYIGKWNVSNVVTMESMFSGATSFNEYIGGWDVSKMTNMSNLFSVATLFNRYIGNWNVSNVVTKESMFSGATTFNESIGDWNVGKVTSMAKMFSGATSFNQYIGDWDITKVGSMSKLLENTNLSTTNYDYLLYNWSLLNNLQRDVTFGAGNTKYSAAVAAARQKLIDDFNWTITDGGLL